MAKKKPEETPEPETTFPTGSSRHTVIQAPQPGRGRAARQEDVEVVPVPKKNIPDRRGRKRK